MQENDNSTKNNKCNNRIIPNINKEKDKDKENNINKNKDKLVDTEMSNNDLKKNIKKIKN